MLISYGASLIVWSHLHFFIKSSKVVSVLTPVCIATSFTCPSYQWGYLFRGDSTWDLDPLSDKHNTLSRKRPYQCQYNVKLELFWCTKALCQAQEFKEKRMRQRDFVLLLNSCFRMRDLKEEWGKMPLNLYGAAGERKELFWKQYEHGRVLSLQMPWPFSRMRFALSLLKARAHHCWVNQRST